MRGETIATVKEVADSIFQSTPLMRGETRWWLHGYSAVCISIHSPHARGDNIGVTTNQQMIISIHSPHARGDPRFRPAPQNHIISIHSPHARGDCLDSKPVYMPFADFNPLPSCEGRLPRREMDIIRSNFNPLPSCEGRPERRRTATFTHISIHSPHARGDR